MLRFKQISVEFPEEYIVYDIGFFRLKRVSYINIRYGKLTVKDIYGDEIIYFDLGGLKGSFYDKTERKKYFSIIEEKIIEHYKELEFLEKNDEDDYNDEF